MKIEELQILLPKIKKIPLKGWEAHKMLVPLDRNYQIDATENYKIASVLALLYPENGEIYLALIKRATYNGKHSGQVAFPGGKQEKEDKTHWETAIRETEEEIGISAAKIKHIKNLSSVLVPVSEFVVNPFLGIIDFTPNFILQKEEVADMVKIKFSSFLKIDIEEVNISSDEKKRVLVPSFPYGNHAIWGATAMMLNELKMLFIECMEL